MSHLYLVTALSILFSCGSKSSNKDLVEYSDGKQLLTVNNVNRDGSDFNRPEIRMITPESGKIGEAFLVKIFLADTTMMIADAFVGCDSVEKASVDTLTYKISGCKNGLIVKDDTILIGFTPTTAGLKTFPTITILTKDKEKVFRTMEYTFDYNVLIN